MKSKSTVTIGIPAYNEAGNISYLLQELLDQVSTNYILNKLIVNSDASTDETDKLVESFSDDRIQLVKNSVREGQGAKQNQILDMCTSDILVLLNADILINDNHFIEHIIEPIQNGADLVCGPLLELAPKTLLERVICFGSVYRRRVFEKFKNGVNVFTCHGSHRAMSKKFYTSFRFKGSVAEDAYSYLWCIKNDYVYAYTRNASVTIKMPSTLPDHIRQSSRFFMSGNKLNTYFDGQFLKTNYQWPISIFFTEGVKMFVKQPVEAIVYALISTFILVKNCLGINDKSEAWKIVVSSKTLRNEL